MAISLVNRADTSPATSANAYIDVTLPGSRVEGNVLVVWVGAAGGLTAPAGWSVAVTPAGSAGYWLGAYYRVIDGTEAPIQRWTFNAAATCAATCMQFSGVDATVTLGSNTSSQNNSATGTLTLVIPSVTTTEDGAYVLSAIAQDGSNASHTPPVQQTEIVHLGGSSTRAFGVAGETKTTAGVTGTRTWTMTTGSTRWVGAMFALKPVSDTPPPATPALGSYLSHGASPTLVGTTDGAYGENSGLAHSLKFNALYSHTDAGGGQGPQVHLFSTADATLSATLTLNNFLAVDVEDICLSRYDGKVYVADTGNTPGNRTTTGDMTIAGFPEPATATTQTITPTIYPVTYADGNSRDVEALAIRPTDGRVFLVGKGNGRLWTAPFLIAGQMTTFNDLGPEVGVGVTGADFSPDGRYLAISQSDDTIRIIDSQNWSVVDTWQHLLAGNMEAICWARDGSALYYANDTQSTSGSSIYRVTVEYVPMPTIGRQVKVWDGAAWVARPVKVWNGSAWVRRPVRG